MLPPKRRRSARLRKKLYVGEFQEQGFQFKAVLKGELSPDQEEALLCRFLDDVVEPRSLGMGGGLTDAFIGAFGRGSATEADRDAVRAWFEQLPECGHIDIGPLRDAWYDDWS